MGTSPTNQSKIAKSWWDGTLSRDEFHTAATAFAEQWNKFNSDLARFSWVPPSNSPWLPPTSKAEGYLSVENVILSSTTEEGCNEGDDEEEKEELCCSDMDGFIDDATLVSTVQLFFPFCQAQNHSHANHHYDFHIVYNASYRVPVLYFRAYYDDGKVLVLDDVEKGIPSSSAKLLKESKWTFITQEDHPYLNRPWCTLHPCGTSEWVKMLFNREPAMDQDGVAVSKYLVSWFSVVGQLFGLKIPLEMLGSVGQL